MGKKNKGKKGKRQQDGEKNKAEEIADTEMDLAANMLGLTEEQKKAVKENALKK